MKLRFRGNHLRLRLNRREAERLASGGVLEESVAFPGGASLSYVLESEYSSSARASFNSGVIRISAPASAAKAWVEGEDIGIYFELPAGGESLQIAIEKDLECIDLPPEERDPDAFPRTEKSCSA